MTNYLKLELGEMNQERTRLLGNTKNRSNIQNNKIKYNC